MSIEKLHFELTADASKFEKSISSCETQIRRLNKSLINAIDNKRVNKSFSLDEAKKTLDDFHKKLASKKINIDTLFAGGNWSQSNWAKMMMTAGKEYDKLKKITGSKDAALGLAKDFSYYNELMVTAGSSLKKLKKEDADRKKTAQELKAAAIAESEQKKEQIRLSKELAKAEKVRAAEQKKEARELARNLQKQSVSTSISNTGASAKPTNSLGFSKSLKDVQYEINAINAQYKKLLGLTFGPNIVAVGNFQKKLKELGVDIDQINKKSKAYNASAAIKVDESARTELDALKKITGGTTESVIKLVKEFQEYSIAVSKAKLATVDAHSEFGKLTKNVATSAKRLEAFDKSVLKLNQWEAGIKQINKLSSSLWVFSMGMQQFGQSMMYGFTAPVATAGIASSKFAADFEKSMAQIQVASGITEDAGKSFQKYLGEQMQSLSLIIPVATKELESYAFAAAQAGVADREMTAEGKADMIIKYTASIAKLKTVEKDYAGTSSDLAELLTKTMLNYGIQNEYVENVASAITEASESTTGGLSDIKEGLVRASSGAGTFNVSLGTTLGLLKTLLPSSGSAARAGTQLSNVYTKMAQNLKKSFDGSSKTVSELTQVMGMSAEDIENSLNTNAGDFFVSLIEKFSQYNGAVNTSNTLTAIFGENTQKVVQNLINAYDRLPENIRKSQEALKDGTLLQDKFNVVADTFSGTMQRFQNALSVLGTEIGASVNESFGGLLNILLNLTITAVAFWKNLGEGWKKFIIYATALVALIGPLTLFLKFTVVNFTAGIVTMTAKLGSFVITTGLLEKAAIRAGIAETFLGSSIAKTSATASGSGVLSMLKMSSAAGGFKGVVQALIPILSRLGVVALAIAGVASVFYAAWSTNILGIKDKLSGMFNGLGINTSTKALQDKLSVSTPFDEEYNKKQKEGLNTLMADTAGAGEEIVRIFGSWGNAFVDKYIKKFSETDTDTFTRSLDIAKQVFEEQKKLGEISEKQVYELGTTARTVIAKAILDVKRLGKVSSSSKSDLVTLVGKDRTDSIIKAIKATIKVDKLQDAFDSVSDNLESLNDAMEKAVDSIQDQIDSAEKQFKIDTRPIENAIKNYEKQISTLTKQMNAELKPLEDKANQQEKAVDAAQDLYDAIKKQNEAEIKVYEDQLDAEEKKLDDQEDLLEALQKLREKELKLAEGMVAYQQMNYDAAKDQLSLETAMGNDEFNLSFRVAQARSEQALEQLKNAKAQEARVKYAYNSQVDIQQAIVDGQQAVVDALNDQIDAIQDTHDAIEEQYEAQVDAAEDALEITNDAIALVKETWGEQISALEEQRDFEQEKLSDMKSIHDDYISTLEEQKEAVEDRYKKEIEIEEAKVTAAEKSLEAAKTALENINKLNDELKSLEAERIGANTDVSSGGGGGGGADINSELDKQMEEYQRQIDELMGGSQEDKKSSIKIDDIIADSVFAMIDALPQDFRNMLTTMQTTYDEFKPLFKESWDATWLEITGGQSAFSIGIEAIQTGMHDTMLGNSQLWSGLMNEDISAMWTGIKTTFEGQSKIVEGILDISFGWLVDTASGYAILISEEVKEMWETFKEDTGTIWGLIDTLVSTGWEDIKTKTETFSSNLWSYAETGFEDFTTKISEFVEDIIEYFEDLPEKIKTALSGLGNALYDAFKDGFDGLSDKWEGLFDGAGDGVKSVLKKAGLTFAAGGIIPGNFSQEVPITAHGSEMVLNPKQQKALWDVIANGRQVASGAGTSTTINFNPGMMIASKGEMRAFAREVAEYINIENSRTNT